MTFRDASVVPTLGHSAGIETEIPAILLTMDRDLDLTCFCIEAYAHRWPGSPLRFLVPVNSGEGLAALKARIPPGIRYKPVMTDPRIVPTLRALLSAAGTSPWTYWCSSDRYPYAAVSASRLNNVVRAIAADCLPADIHSVRITRWRDVAELDGREIELGGENFGTGRAPKSGYWHHQFLRREALATALQASDEADGLREFARRFRRSPAWQSGRFLLARHSLMKFEETMIEGKHTLNFALRQMRRGHEPEIARVGAATESYVSPVVPHQNHYWDRQKLEPLAVLGASTAAAPFHVVSFGGVGSKMITRWLQPDAEEGAWKRSHSHRRLPPLAYGPGERVIYVFGDPRNAVLSIFNRREGRSALHGFVPRANANPARDFALRHAANIEVDPAPLQADWDLNQFLRHGFDVFRLEEHFDYWLHGDLGYPVLFVRYEKIADNAATIATHLGIAPRPIVSKARGSDWRKLSAQQRGGINALYGSFADRLDALPDAFLVEGGKLRDVASLAPIAVDEI